MPISLDPAGKRLFRFLVNWLPQVDLGRITTLPTYSGIHSSLSLPLEGPTYGISLDNQGLASVAYWTIGSDLPALTGLVVEQFNTMPAAGFWTLYKRDSSNVEDLIWWIERLRECKKFRWKDLSEYN